MRFPLLERPLTRAIATSCGILPLVCELRFDAGVYVFFNLGLCRIQLPFKVFLDVVK